MQHAPEPFALSPAAYAREAERLRFMARRAEARAAANGDPQAKRDAKRLARQCVSFERRAQA